MLRRLAGGDERLIDAIGIANVLSRFSAGDMPAPTRAVLDVARRSTRELGGNWPDFLSEAAG